MRTLIACAALLAVPLCGSTIVGIDNGSGALFKVNPVTGEVTPIPGHAPGPSYYATSTAPDSNAFLAYSPINLYQLDLFGEAILHACDCDEYAHFGDLAYDPSKREIYGLATLWDGVPRLFRLVDTGLPYYGRENSHWVHYSGVGELEGPDIRVMEYVPGLGLYGTYGDSGYVIDEATGRARLLAPLHWHPGPEPSIPFITGLAYDSATGRLLGTCGGGPCLEREIFLIEPRTGAVTLLNGNAPNLYGIAAVSIPEPQPAWFVLAGLAAIVVLRRSIPQKLS